jgi:hypothetical protein
MGKVYHVLNWNEFYENNKSKAIKDKRYGILPNKQNGLEYIRLVSRENGAALYGCFCAMILYLSRQSGARQGYLTDTGCPDGVPLSALDLSAVCRLPAETFQEMLDAVTSKDIGWVEVVEISNEGTTGTLYVLNKDTMCPKGVHDTDTRGPSYLNLNQNLNQKQKATDTMCPSDGFDFAKVLLLYNERLYDLKPEKFISDDQITLIKTAIKIFPEYVDLQKWKEYFIKVSESDFLTGKKSAFKADFEWLITPANMKKVLENKYTDIQKGDLNKVAGFEDL